MSSFSPPSASAVPLPVLAGRNYHCQCGQPVFFRNSQCLACGTPLGYDCERSILLPLMAAADLPGGADPFHAIDQATGQTVSNGADQGLSPAGAAPPAVQWQAWRAAPLLPDAEPYSLAPADPSSARQDGSQPPCMEDIPGQQSSGFDAPATGAPGSSADASALNLQAAAPLGPLDQARYKRCLNLSTPASCNWLIAADDPQGMCRACRLNRTIPDLLDASLPDNGYLWGKVELAKRRLVSSLITLRLPVASKMSEDLQTGLMFDFLRSPAGGPHVMTGHDTGLITLNVDEADDAKREAVRKAMREPYRTLLGHFRHEVGHYYWDRLVAGTPWIDGFHQLFGDESIDYAAALKLNYEQGPPSDWPLHFVSAYASTHPWEDWAECWAHYLHMRDTVDTALSFGLSVERFNLEFTPFTLDAVYQPDHPDAAQFLAFLNHWMQLTTMLNEMSRSMGQPDFYPFVLPRDVVAKLHFIDLVVAAGGRRLDAAPPASEATDGLQDFRAAEPLATANF